MWFKNRFRLNLFCIFKDRRAAVNHLDTIDENAPDFLVQCRDLAHMLVAGSGEEREPYWNDMVEIVLTGLIAFVCACEPDRKLRTLTTVRKLVSSRSAFSKSIEVMKQTQGFHGVIAHMGKLLQWPVDLGYGQDVIAAAARSISPT